MPGRAAPTASRAAATSSSALNVGHRLVPDAPIGVLIAVTGPRPSAACTRWRLLAVALSCSAERTSGCRNRMSIGFDADELGALGRIECVMIEPELSAGLEHRTEVPAVIGCGDEQRDLRGCRKALDPPLNSAMQPRRERHRLRQRIRPASCASARPVGSSISASGFPCASASSAGARDAAASPRLRVQDCSARVRPAVASQAAGQAGCLEAALLALACREDHRHAIAPQPACGEHERLRGRLVEPLCVVDQAKDRPSSAAAASRPRIAADTMNAIGRIGGRQSERARQAPRLGFWQLVERDPGPDARARRSRRRRGRPRLRHPSSAIRSMPRVRGRVVEQRGLPDAGLAADHQRRAFTGGARSSAPRAPRIRGRGQAAQRPGFAQPSDPSPADPSHHPGGTTGEGLVISPMPRRDRCGAVTQTSARKDASMTTYASPTPSTVASALEGRIVLPPHNGWDEARLAWNLAVDQRPAAVVPESAHDVAAASCLPRARSARRRTGHRPRRGAARRRSTTPSCSRPSGCAASRSTPSARVARVQAGTLWHESCRPRQSTASRRLPGSSPDVGVVGYTLGGGLSFLGRKYGLAANNVRVGRARNRRRRRRTRRP